VARAHGVRGQLRIETHDPESNALDRAEIIRIGEIDYAVESAHRVQGAYLVRVAGIADRDGAHALRSQTVAGARAALDLDEGELLLADLIGCAVVTGEGVELGTVIAIDVGPQSRLVVRDQRVERLIPVVDEFLLDIDADAGRIVVDLPEG